MPMPRRSLALALACLVAAGCAPGTAPKVATKTTHPTTANASPSGLSFIGLSGAALISQDGGTLISQDGGSLISQDGGSLATTAEAGLISQDGGSLTGSVSAPASLISQDGGSLISQDGGSIVAQGGGNIVAQGGGNIVAQGGGNYRLAAFSQVPVAHAHVYLRTADGRFVKDAKGDLLTAATDAKGHFAFAGLAATAGLSVFVPMAAPKGKVDALQALLTKEHARDKALAVDVASTLVGTYVLNQFVASQPAAQRGKTLDRLTDALQDAAIQDAAAALGSAKAPAALDAASVVGYVDGLRCTSSAVNDDLGKIRKALVLAGSDTTTGTLTALQTPLQNPLAVAADHDGNVYEAEGLGGVLRKIAPDGKVTELLGPGSAVQPNAAFSQICSLAFGPDGLLYFADPYSDRIWRISTDGKTLEAVLGVSAVDQTAATAPGRPALPANAKAPDVPIFEPRTVAFDAAGNMYVGESRLDLVNQSGFLLKVAPDKTVTQIPLDAPDHGLSTQEITGVAVTPDGTLWVGEFSHGQLFYRAANQTRWSVYNNVAIDRSSGIVALPDNGVLASGGGSGQILRYASDGSAPSVLAGVAGGTKGAAAVDGPAATATFTKLAGIGVGPGGEVYVADLGSASIRMVKDGQVKTIAGASGTIHEGDALLVSLNVPGGVTVDAQGRPVVAEAGTGTIKRLEGDKMVTIAGNSTGYGGDGGPAIQASFNNPAQLAYDGDVLYVADVSNNVIRKIDKDNVVTTVVGLPKRKDNPLPDSGGNALAFGLMRLTGVAVSPDHHLYFMDHQRVFKVDDAGNAVRIAGFSSADGLTPPAVDPDPGYGKPGTPGLQTALGFSASMAFDKAGNLYLADSASCLIRKIDPAGVVTPVAGVGLAATAAGLLGGGATSNAGTADQALLMLPLGVTVAPDGRIYVTEYGTRGANDARGDNANVPVLPTGLDLPVLNGRIRQIDPDGKTRILAGTGAPAGSSSVVQPTGVALDATGRLVFVDSGAGLLEVLDEGGGLPVCKP